MPENNYKFLQIGLGSMGKRRIRNLMFHGVSADKIFGFDLSNTRSRQSQKEYGIKTYADFHDACEDCSPDAFIISTPPNQHHQYFLRAAHEKKHFFVEATVSSEGYDELLAIPDSGYVRAPSCTLRCMPAIIKIKEILDGDILGTPLTFQHHLGQYLPDWHPWEDYKNVYFSKKETGACKEMFVFELTALTYVFNSEIAKLGGFVDKISGLAMSADDIHAVVIKLRNNMIGTVMIDALSRNPSRRLKIICSLGSLEWDWLDHKIKIYDANKKVWRKVEIVKGETAKDYTASEDIYRDEIKLFLDSIRGISPYPYTFQEDRKILQALYALEESSQSGKIITL